MIFTLATIEFIEKGTNGTMTSHKSTNLTKRGSCVTLMGQNRISLVETSCCIKKCIKTGDFWMKGNVYVRKMCKTGFAKNKKDICKVKHHGNGVLGQKRDIGEG